MIDTACLPPPMHLEDPVIDTVHLADTLLDPSAMTVHARTCRHQVKVNECMCKFSFSTYLQTSVTCNCKKTCTSGWAENTEGRGCNDMEGWTRGVENLGIQVDLNHTSKKKRSGHIHVFFVLCFHICSNSRNEGSYLQRSPMCNTYVILNARVVLGVKKMINDSVRGPCELDQLNEAGIEV